MKKICAFLFGPVLYLAVHYLLYIKYNAVVSTITKGSFNVYRADMNSFHNSIYAIYFYVLAVFILIGFFSTFRYLNTAFKKDAGWSYSTIFISFYVVIYLVPLATLYNWETQENSFIGIILRYIFVLTLPSILIIAYWIFIYGATSKRAVNSSNDEHETPWKTVTKYFENERGKKWSIEIKHFKGRRINIKKTKLN